ncbi:DUF3579 domain-containing protein [Trinickia diaoshuihuensis]|uniref:DUF3579 domain-containing protein n=1 Tax=Trinickia diaoshuihuensis TaxID=2292265 RepID=UPI000E27258E|nr:DUF3579 domain-containing protein [Trinickia diaoshuihuensis]
MTTIEHGADRSAADRSPADRSPAHRIVGITYCGKTFRPGDWAERLAGVIALFVQERRPGYRAASTWLAMPFVEDGVRCLKISGELAQICPEAFEFVMRFAQDNELRIQTY